MSKRASAQEVAAVLAKVLAGARLRRIPRHPQHRKIVLALVCLGLRRRRAYSEAELNERIESELAKLNADVDHVTCRRYLVDLGFVKRDRAGTRYILNYPKLEAALSEGAMETAPELLRNALAAPMGRLRTALADDAPLIAQCHARSWRAAYPGAEYLGSVDEGATRWQRRLQDPSVSIAAHDRGGELLGFVCVGPSRDANANPGTRELAAICVDPDHWRQGIGRSLLHWAHNQAADGQLVSWVHEDNAGARAFYQRMGWSEWPDRHREADELIEVRLARRPTP